MKNLLLLYVESWSGLLATSTLTQLGISHPSHSGLLLPCHGSLLIGRVYLTALFVVCRKRHIDIDSVDVTEASVESAALPTNSISSECLGT